MPAYKTPDVGRLRNRLTWQRLDESQLDSVNQPTSTWTTLGTGIPAHVEPLGGMEAMNAKQLKETVSHKIRVRAGIGYVAPSDQFINEETGGCYGVTNVYREDERIRYYILHCEELPPQ